MNVKELKNKISGVKCRSAWSKGVKETAFDLLYWADLGDGFEIPKRELKTLLLNGAMNWRQFAEGGNGLVYNSSIAATFCNATELKRCKGGKLQPNRSENWIDLYTRGLSQAYLLILKCLALD